MILYRYMRTYELKRYLRGDTLESDTNHFENYRTNSNGFCFLGEETVFEACDGNTHTYSPSKCLEFLTGIVSEDILACFYIPDDMVSESNGTYADPFGQDDEEITIKEYNVNQYSKQTCQLLKLTIPVYTKSLQFDWFVPEI